MSNLEYLREEGCLNELEMSHKERTEKPIQMMKFGIM